MKLHPRQKKWLKVLLWLILLRFLLVGGFYYMVEYQLKSLVQVFVELESEGDYRFDAGMVDVSLWKHRVEMRNVTLLSTDTNKSATRYDVRIPEIVCTIRSWQELLLDRHLTIESLQMLTPFVRTHTDAFDTVDRPSFHASKIMNVLKRLMAHLQVRDLHLKNGGFAFHHPKSKNPFRGDHINFRIRNFSDENGEQKKLLGAEDMELNIDQQSWELPDGRHTLSFKRLHFSGKNQYFELDSCRFSSLPDANGRSLMLKADRLMFNSHELAAIYEDEKLILDTVICYRPVLHLQTWKANRQTSDSVLVLANSLHQLFRELRFRYVDIRDGQLLLNDQAQNSSRYASEKTNLKIYNLALDPEKGKGITTDSIRLGLEDLSFMTRDSLFRMSIDELSFNNNNVVFHNAVFAPTDISRADKVFMFKAPTLELENISLEDLLNRKLTASIATLDHPVLVFKGGLGKKQVDSTASMRDFYAVLHDLSELIAVQEFLIHHGNLMFVAPGRSQVRVQVKDFTTRIHLDDFLQSGSLLNIKQSLPFFSAGEVLISSRKMKLELDNFHMYGDLQKNTADRLLLTLSNGMVFQGRGIHFEKLNWDEIQQERLIKAELLQVEELDVLLPAAGRKRSGPSAKAGIVVDVCHLNIGTVRVKKGNDTSEVFHFVGANILVDSLRSPGGADFSWHSLSGTLHALVFHNRHTQLSLDRLVLSGEEESSLRNLRLRINQPGGYIKVDVPTLKFHSNIHATLSETYVLRTLFAQNPEFDLCLETKEHGDSRPFSLPINLCINEMDLDHASLHYFQPGLQPQLDLHFDLRAKTFRTYQTGDRWLSYAKMDLHARDLNLGNSNLRIELPAIALKMQQGSLERGASGGLALNTAVAASWDNLQLGYRLNDSCHLQLQDAKGGYQDPHFHWSPGTKPSWSTWIYHLNLEQGALRYSNPAFSLRADSLRWEPDSKHLQLRHYAYEPRQSLPEFLEEERYQRNYLAAEGQRLDLTELRLSDTLFYARKLDLDQVQFVSAKDKTKPLPDHVPQKPMPTQWLQGIRPAFQIDTITLRHSRVEANMISASTGRAGIIPIEELNALVTRFGNRFEAKDSLSILGTARILDNQVRQFIYKEAYRDSLSTFRLQFLASDLQLSNVSSATIPWLRWKSTVDIPTDSPPIGPATNMQLRAACAFITKT